MIGSHLWAPLIHQLVNVFDYKFTQHILEPTHEKGNVLDLVLTSPCVSVTIHPLSSLSFSGSLHKLLTCLVMPHL